MQDASSAATPEVSPVASRMQSSTPSSLRSQPRSRTNSQNEVPFLPSIGKTPMGTTTLSPEPLHPLEQVLTVDQPVLPEPTDLSKCALFCCFYAEFDNVVGPKVCFQSPRHFMDQDIGISTEHVHEILAEAFQDIKKKNTKNSPNGGAEDVVDEGETSQRNHDDTTSTEPNPDEVSSSIFDSTSEYVITGNELAGKMICLSTHRIHILTRPTVITNERYERNSLLFCLGFVLRREEDPRPFRPLLSKWAVALRSMEVESQFLTKPTLRPRLQPMLERLLVSLNSRQRECNLLLDSANSLNLKLFRPPKQPATPVPDHMVPVLLRTDCFQMYDWDLAINWVVMHIDGAKHARWISTKSDVDMEMVRACLRVLKHHKVIALVDMFFYSDRYESTDRAAAMLAGKEPKLLQDAFDYVSRQRHSDGGLSDSTHSGVANAAITSLSNHERTFSPVSSFSVSFPPLSSSQIGSVRGSSPKHGSANCSQDVHPTGLLRRQQKKLRTALAELYCSCNRNMSFADLWLAKATEANQTSSASRPVGNGEGGGESGVSTNRTTPTDIRTGRSLPEGQGSLHNYQKSKATGVETMSPRGGTRPESTNIDWKEVFQSFDHRRFATFGVIHGLIRRVHNYPAVYDVAVSNRNEMEELILAHDAEPRVEPSRSATFRNESTSFQQQHSVQEHRGTATSFRTKAESNQNIVSELVSKMDGTRCDDELVCMFEKPLEDLFDLVKSVGNKNVFSVYSSLEEE